MKQTILALVVVVLLVGQFVASDRDGGFGPRGLAQTIQSWFIPAGAMSPVRGDYWLSPKPTPQFIELIDEKVEQTLPAYPGPQPYP